MRGKKPFWSTRPNRKGSGALRRVVSSAQRTNVSGVSGNRCEGQRGFRAGTRDAHFQRHRFKDIVSNSGIATFVSPAFVSPASVLVFRDVHCARGMAHHWCTSSERTAKTFQRRRTLVRSSSGEHGSSDHRRASLVKSVPPRGPIHPQSGNRGAMLTAGAAHQRSPPLRNLFGSALRRGRARGALSCWHFGVLVLCCCVAVLLCCCVALVLALRARQ